MMSKLPLLILAALTLWSCGTGSTQAFCTLAKPIFLKGDDVLTDATMQDMIVNDDARQQLCGRFDGHELFDLGLAEKTP